MFGAFSAGISAGGKMVRMKWKCWLGGTLQCARHSNHSNRAQNEYNRTRWRRRTNRIYLCRNWRDNCDAAQIFINHELNVYTLHIFSLCQLFQSGSTGWTFARFDWSIAVWRTMQNCENNNASNYFCANKLRTFNLSWYAHSTNNCIYLDTILCV